ncbi:MAG: cupin domain-containing protein [Pseudomonadota bacterium]
MPNVVSKMDWSTLRHEYDLDAKRLLPWDAVKAPFEGAWCVVRPGTQSRRHHHDELELFITISGQADIVINGTHHTVSKGDLVSIPKGADHYIDNSGTEDFHMYTLFWSAESAAQFLSQEAH